MAMMSDAVQDDFMALARPAPAGRTHAALAARAAWRHGAGAIAVLRGELAAGAAQQAGRELARRRAGRRLGDGARVAIAARLRGAVDGVGGQAHELLGALEFALFVRRRFRFQPQRAAGRRSQAAADLGPQRAAQIAADGAAGQRNSLLRHTLEHAADGLSHGRLDDAARHGGGLAQEIAEKLFQLGFIAHRQQFIRQLHLLGLGKHGVRTALAAPLALAELELFRFKSGHLLSVFQGRTIYVMHDELLKVSTSVDTSVRITLPDGLTIRLTIEHDDMPALAVPAASVPSRRLRR